MGVVKVTGVASGGKRTEHVRGLPLAVVIARYFAYVLVSSVVLAAMVFALFMMLVSCGVVYAANYAEQNVGEALTGLEDGTIQPQDLPSCFHWAVLDNQENVTSSDMGEDDERLAQKAALAGRSVVYYDGLRGAVLQEVAVLPSGNRCVLQYDYLPDFVARPLRDTLLDPQSLMGVVLLVLFVTAMALIASRAARVISIKMRPLTEAAAHIEQQDLNFSVGSSNVREVNEVLAAVERMRGALDESLHARWAADEARRRQMAALAHDLKTPLSIARWNVDLLRETRLEGDQEACAVELAGSIEHMEGYVRLLVETSQVGAAGAFKEDVDVADLAAEVERQTRPLCEARGLVLDFACDAGGMVHCDRVQLARAAANLVSNAAEHAPTGSHVAVRFSQGEETVRLEVADAGSGFSAAALEHGKERFYTERDDRGSADGHYGLGLSIVEDIAAAHGGTLELSNRDGGGAVCVVEVPRD